MEISGSFTPLPLNVMKEATLINCYCQTFIATKSKKILVKNLKCISKYILNSILPICYVEDIQTILDIVGARELPRR